MPMHGQISTGAGIQSEPSQVTRRTWLGLLATPLYAARKKTGPTRRTGSQTKESPARVAGTVRERVWIFAGGGDGIMTPAESALYLGTPNLILALPPKNRSFDRQLALSVSGFTQVVWGFDDLDL